MSLIRRRAALATGIAALAAGGGLTTMRWGGTALSAMAAEDLDAARSMGRFISRTGMGLLARLVEGEPRSNAVVAPGSIITALGMAAAATSDETRTTLAAALAAEPDGGIALDSLLERLGGHDRALRARTEGTEIATAAALLIAKTARADAAFLESLERALRVRAASVDFGDAATIEDLNSWISRNTQGLIKSSIKGFPPLTELVLATTVVFKGRWQAAFDKAATRDGRFLTAAGREMRLPLMSAEARDLPYLRQGPIHAVRLPYRGNAFELVLAMTDGHSDTSLSSWVARTTPEEWRRIIDPQDYRSAKVSVTLPRQQIDTVLELLPLVESNRSFAPLTAVPVKLGRLTDRKVALSKVQHMALVRMDEEGTVAAAATVVQIETVSALPRSIDFRVDRPHVFAIRHVPTDTVVFAGYVAEPAPAPEPAG